MTEIRARNSLDPADMENLVGKMLEPTDVDVMLTGPARVMKPDGKPLCVYLPGALGELRATAWEVLATLKGSYTDNRGIASGAKRYGAGGRSNDAREGRTRGKMVDSAIIGSFGPAGVKQYCRLTAWTGRENERWQALWPTFQHIGDLLGQHVPERYAAQAKAARATHPEWLVPGTPFTTITVNNTYATAVHKDKGDLEEGFSTLAVLRKGEFEGGWICFPEFRCGVDMQDGDVLLMDAHAWHGNTPLSPEPERDLHGRIVGDPGFERISIVSYFRANMVACGSAEEEVERARIYGENRMGARVGE